MNKIERQVIIRRVTWVGACIDAVLAFFKILVGWLVHSPALIADGFHSLSDLLTDAAVVVFSHWAQADPDDEHPYGHHRYETLGTVILGTTLIVVASIIAWDSILSLIYGNHTPNPSAVAIIIALISIVSKEWIFRYTILAAKRVKSNLLEANAWHSRSDAFSSIVVLVGVIATWFGYGWVELYAAIGVAILIGKMGVTLTWNASQELIDRGIDPEEARKIKKIIQETPGVVDVHLLRSRMMGNHIYIDVHIQVDSIISVSEGHFISERVVQQVRSEHDQVSDVTVHVDHEEDFDDNHEERQVNDASEDLAITHLPERKIIEQELKAHHIEPVQLQLHYIGNHIDIDLIYEQEPKELAKIKQVLDAWVEKKAWLGNYTFYIKK
jgi:cation diffusion facilitator family transporter